MTIQTTKPEMNDILDIVKQLVTNIIVLFSFYVEVNVAKRIRTFSKNCISPNGGDTRSWFEMGGCEGSDPKMGGGGKEL